jgi:hypothetical protein
LNTFKIITVFLLLGVAFTASAQKSARIKGVILENGNRPIADVNIIAGAETTTSDQNIFLVFVFFFFGVLF